MALLRTWTLFDWLFVWFGKKQRIHAGMDEMYKIVHQYTYRFFGIDEMYKLVMDEMYEIIWIWIFWN